jgi:hypothetical protein
MSKNFKPEEIKGYLEIDGKQVVYLKTGVKRLKYNDDLGVGDHFEQMNQTMISNELREKVIKLLYGGDDFDEPGEAGRYES